MTAQQLESWEESIGQLDSWLVYWTVGQDGNYTVGKSQLDSWQVYWTVGQEANYTVGKSQMEMGRVEEQVTKCNL
jgi:hypothetical protein